MQQHDLDRLAMILETNGIEYSIRQEYSGRGMYGTSTLALVVKCRLMNFTQQLEHKLEYLYEDFEDEDFEDLENEEDDLKLDLMLLRRLKEDNMAMEYVWY